jgi:serine/threonine protein kinase
MSIENLVGLTLDDNWLITELLSPSINGTGGHFSKQYKVKKGNKEAFLKAMDWSEALRSKNVPEELNRLTEEYLFEKRVGELCKKYKMSKVVTPIGFGQVLPPLGQYPVHYIIYELANGDLRSDDLVSNFNNVGWLLRVMHHATVGMRQLHSKEILHQDLKPSNVLIFDDFTSKIADLGRASALTLPFKYDEMPFAGDSTYAPIDILMGARLVDFDEKYLIDLYLLGSLLVYLILGVPTTPLIIEKVKVMKGIPKGDFETVKPYIEIAFENIIQDVESKLINCSKRVREGVIDIIKEMCNPDPKRRGLKGQIKLKGRANLERYISKVNLVTSFAEIDKCRC